MAVGRAEFDRRRARLAVTPARPSESVGTSEEWVHRAYPFAAQIDILQPPN